MADAADGKLKHNIHDSITDKRESSIHSRDAATTNRILTRDDEHRQAAEQVRYGRG